MKKLLVVLGAAFLFASCQNSNWPTGGDEFQPQAVEFTEIAQGSLTGDALVYTPDFDFDNMFEDVEFPFDTMFGDFEGFEGFDTVFDGFSYSLPEMEMVVTNAERWQGLMNYMDSITPNITATFAETDVDFENYYVIAVFGEVEDEAGTIEITGITENLTHLLVEVEDQETETPLVHQPFHIVKIAKTDKPILFD